ncbi:hypothetical protein [Sphingosinicella sp. BN140058]|uniref:hypothetical protein n=1 Tax=Sphingosinicella sp. BN140058 TaxID=1892855 RepID=UPI00101322B2|nr:hypothetical protein [Sphingosinicella sp. BN140058]QAY80149.1 hypothetical protein ETR14_26260 [Sphingosinicella sp. BN140058]
MGNIIVSLLTLMMTLAMMSFGAYSSFYAAQRAKVSTVVGRTLERQLIYLAMTREDLGRVPTAGEVLPARISGEDGGDISYFYGTGAGYGYVCARTERRGWREEAFQRVRDQRPGALYGGDCDTNGAPSGTYVSVTVRIS